MFVGVDVGSNSILAIAVNAEGVVTSRRVSAGRTKAVLGEAVRAVAQGNAERIGLAVRAGDAIFELAEAAGGAAGRVETATVATGTAIALGEQWVGAARGYMHVVSLSIDDHAQGGIVIAGQPYNGARGAAGDVAWLALNPVERDDYRRFGCLEAEISAAGIARRLVWRVKTGDPSRAQDLAGGNLSDVSATHVFDAARAGDGVAVSVVRDTARYIGMAIANLVALVDPQVVVLGGVIATASDLLIEPARAEAIHRMSPAAVPKIVPAVLGDDGAALGAARAAILKG